MLEYLAAHRLIDYIRDANLLPLFQSGFRPLHPTETVVLHVLSDILDALDHSDVRLLLLPDLSAAFNTVDHDKLLRRPEQTFGASDNTFSWLASYPPGRDYFVRLEADCSNLLRLTSGVPERSVLGSLLII
jgi:hypothetical protein